MEIVKVKDLKDQINTTAPRELLHCFYCGAEYSANKGDYFAIDPEHVFKCCDEPMAIVTKRVVYTIGGRK